MSIANILLRGLGSGAQSLGASTFQQQEQRRREEAVEAQRMAALQQQERTRIATAQEQARLKNDETKRRASETAAIAKTLGIELPEGAGLTPDGLRLLADDRRARLQQEQEDGRNSRYGQGLEARMAQIEAQNNAAAQVRAAQAAANEARAALLNRTDPNARSGGSGRAQEDPEAEYTKTVRSIAQKLMDSQRDEFGSMIGGMEPERAMREATRRADLLFGRQPEPTPPPNPPGTNLLQGLRGGRPPLDSFRR